MSPAEARVVLRRESGGLVEVHPVVFASHLAALVCAVKPIPPAAFESDGMARFACRMSRPMWEAIKVLMDEQFAPTGKLQ